MEESENLRKVLEDAGLYEKNMSKTEMEECYNAISLSKNEIDSTEKKQDYSINEQTSFSLIQLLQDSNFDRESEAKPSTSKSVVSKRDPRQFRRDASHKSHQAPVKSYWDTFSFNDIVDCPKSNLTIIHHNCTTLPLPFNTKLECLPVKEQHQLLFDYHTTITNAQVQLARNSLIPTAKPTSIEPSMDCYSSLLKIADKKSDHDYDFHLQTSENIYVSRSGRQVKRKSYLDEPESDSETSLFIWSPNKKNKSAPSTIVRPPAESKPSTKMHTSKNKSVKSPKGTRSDLLFDNLIKAQETKAKEDLEKKKFLQSLSAFTREENAEVIDEKVTEDEKEMLTTKVRIAPPSLDIKKRNVTKKKRSNVQMDFDKIEVAPTSSPEKKAQITMAEKYQTNSVNCPICYQLFTEDKVQEHASNCEGFSYDFVSSSDENNLKITCEICDKVFVTHASFLEHKDICLYSSG